uniref:Cytochrome c oxidase subunit 3 n=1 Tax=Barynotus obscurus TaxID=1069882 RepID=J9PH05_9CUCU|nr:cytochrome c oxidase subunit III [Barynotus obscurus]
MKQLKNHPYHLVDASPWPLLGSLGTFTMMMGFIKWFHLHNYNLLLMGLLINLLVMYQWWRDIVREATFQGLHTHKVTLGLRWGMILFIISEVFFFLASFWSFLHSSLTPSIELDTTCNTLILLTSGLTITWAHHSIMENNYNQHFKDFLITVILGFNFTLLQVYEYIEAPFTIADSVYGSTFFYNHSITWTSCNYRIYFLFICLMRLYFQHFSSTHHFGFEAAAWYWHFVDVVWLFLYVLIYWWGS